MRKSHAEIVSTLSDIIHSELSLKEEGLGVAIFVGALISLAIFFTALEAVTGFNMESADNESPISFGWLLYLAMPVFQSMRKSSKYNSSMERCYQALATDPKTKHLEISKAELIALQEGKFRPYHFTPSQAQNVASVLTRLKTNKYYIVPYWVSYAFTVYVFAQITLLLAGRCIEVIPAEDGNDSIRQLCSFRLDSYPIIMPLLLITIYANFVQNLISLTNLPYINTMATIYVLSVTTMSRMLTWATKRSSPLLDQLIFESIVRILNRFIDHHDVQLLKSISTIHTKNSLARSLLESMPLDQISNDFSINKDFSFLFRILSALVYSPSAEKIAFLQLYHKERESRDSTLKNSLQKMLQLPVTHTTHYGAIRGELTIILDFSECTLEEKNKATRQLTNFFSDSKIAITEQPSDDYLFKLKLINANFIEIFKQEANRVYNLRLVEMPRRYPVDISPFNMAQKTVPAKKDKIGKKAGSTAPQAFLEGREEVPIIRHDRPEIVYDEEQHNFTFATTLFSRITINERDIPPEKKNNSAAWVSEVTRYFTWHPAKTRRGNGLQRIQDSERYQGTRLKKAGNDPCCKLKYGAHRILFQVPTDADGRHHMVSYGCIKPH